MNVFLNPVSAQTLEPNWYFTLQFEPGGQWTQSNISQFEDSLVPEVFLFCLGLGGWGGGVGWLQSAFVFVLLWKYEL